MSYNTKNFTEQGGDKTVIEGTLEIKGTLKVDEGAEIEGLPKAENQVESEATELATLLEDFNALLTKLKDSGLMEPDEEEDSTPDPEPDPGPEPEDETPEEDDEGDDEDGENVT